MNANRLARQHNIDDGGSASRGARQTTGICVRTLTVRQIPPPPQQSPVKIRLTTDSPEHQRAWMIEQARAEAEIRGDRDAQMRFAYFEGTPFSGAEAGECCLYLFGQVYPEFDALTGTLLYPR